MLRTIPADAQVDQPYEIGLEPGPHAVGFEVLRDHDPTRTYRAPRDAEGRPQDNHRPMLIGVWYPALASQSPVATFGDYVDLVNAIDCFEPPTPAQLLETRRRWSTVDDRVVPELLEVLDRPMWARPSATRVEGSFRTLLYSPGGGGAVHENSILFEFLASHG